MNHSITFIIIITIRFTEDEKTKELIQQSEIDIPEMINKLKGLTRYITIILPDNYDIDSAIPLGTNINLLESNYYKHSKQVMMLLEYPECIYFIYNCIIDYTLLCQNFEKTEDITHPQLLSYSPSDLTQLSQSLPHSTVEMHMKFLESYLERNPYYNCIVDPNPSLGQFLISLKKHFNNNNNNYKLIGIFQDAGNSQKVENAKNNIKLYFNNNNNIEIYESTKSFFSQNKTNSTSFLPLIFYRFINSFDIKGFIEKISIKLSLNQTILISCNYNITIPEELRLKYHIRKEIFENDNNIKYEYYMLSLCSNLIKNEDYFMKIFNDNNYFEEKGVFVNMLGNRYHKKCQLMEGFLYQESKRLCKIEENNTSQLKDDEIISKLLESYHKKQDVNDSYHKSGLQNLAPFIFGDPHYRFSRISELIPPGSTYPRILVVGSIDCDITSPLHKKYPSSEIYIIDTIDSNPRHGTFYQIDSNNSELYMILNHSISLIICISLHHFNDVDKLYEEFQRIMSDSGVLFIYEHDCSTILDYNTLYLYHLFHERFLMRLENKDKHHICNYKSRSEWDSLAIKYGFSIETNQLKTIECVPPLKMFCSVFSKTIVDELEEDKDDD